MKSTDQKKKQRYGLINQGATCYLNSILQILYMTPEMHNSLKHDLQTDRELINIFEGLNEDKCGTENITAAFGIEDVYKQCDAAEHLDMILNKISSQASQFFQVYLKYTTTCSEGHVINEETKDCWTVQLSLIDNPETAYSVEKSFERIFETKSYGGDNKVYCNECGNKTGATSRCEMVKPPQILTLLLKRFDFDYYTMSHFKSNCCVDVPLTLQVKNETYKLYGMVNHSGSLHGGHYTATILSNEGQTWYKFNDAFVCEVPEQPFAKTETYKSSAVYLLMYRATKSQTHSEDNSDGPADTALQKMPETNNLGETRSDEVEYKEHEAERNADKNKKRKREHSEEDEEEVRGKQAKEDFSRQTGGDEADVESAKKDAADKSCEVKSSRDEEAQKHQPMNGDEAHSAIAKENTAVESEELKETEDVGEESAYHSEQLPGEETKAEKYKECCVQIEANSEDQLDEEEQKTGETEDIEDEDEEEVRGKQAKEDFSRQTGGDEADVESAKKDAADKSCEVKSSRDEEAQKDQPMNGDEAHSAIVKENTAVESEELKETEDVGEESAYHSEQLPGEETKAEKYKECRVQIEANSEDQLDEETEVKPFLGMPIKPPPSRKRSFMWPVVAVISLIVILAILFFVLFQLNVFYDREISLPALNVSSTVNATEMQTDNLIKNPVSG